MSENTEQQNPAASYEHARDELAQVVSRLESGGLSLDESLTLWERGEHLARECTAFLDGARERVDAALDRADAAGDPDGDPDDDPGSDSATDDEDFDDEPDGSGE